MNKNYKNIQKTVDKVEWTCYNNICKATEKQKTKANNKTKDKTLGGIYE